MNICSGRLQIANQPGKYLVDIYPILRHLPGTWKYQGRKWHQEELTLYRSQLNRLRTGETEECFGSWLIGHQQGMPKVNISASILFTGCKHL